MNQIIVIGVLKNSEFVKKKELKLLVEDETDNYEVVLQKKLATEVSSKIKKESYVAIKGHLSANKIIADKIVFQDENY